MAQVYAQQAKVVGASPDGDKPMNADGVVSEVAPDSTTKDVNSKKAEESDVSDEEPGDDLPCTFIYLYFFFLEEQVMWRMGNAAIAIICIWIHIKR